MTIAVSAQIKPSRFFSSCIFGMAIMLLLTGLLVISEQAGTFSLAGRMIVTAVSLVSALFLVFLHFRSKKTVQIDISGSGQIHIREDIHNVSAQVSRQKQIASDADVFYLVNGSVIWPSLLLLHVESDSKEKKYLMIFSDAVKEEEFKALYIACQWLIVYQNERQ